MTLSPQIHTQDGRTTATAIYRSNTLEVAAGYDINEDCFRFHAYVTNEMGNRTKVACTPAIASSLNQALTNGLEAGRLAVDTNT